MSTAEKSGKSFSQSDFKLNWYLYLYFQNIIWVDLFITLKDFRFKINKKNLLIFLKSTIKQETHEIIDFSFPLWFCG